MYPNNDFTEGNIFLINNIDTLGKFKLHYGSIFDNPTQTGLRACFVCKIETGNRITLLPGYWTYDKLFHHCPLMACFVQINELEFSNQEMQKFDASVVVFSKDYSQRKPLNIKVNANNPSIGSLNDYINALNTYIDEGNDINLLDDNIFRGQINFNSLNELQLFDIINQLLFKFYEDCLIRVGKDNLFWHEIEITNLPESEYMKGVFVECLSNSRIIHSAKYDREKGFILIEYGREYCYSPSHIRRAIEDSKAMEYAIKDYLKYRLQNIFNPKVEMNERFQKNKEIIS